MFMYYLLSGFAIRGSLVKSNKYLFAGIACVQSHDFFYGIDQLIKEKSTKISKSFWIHVSFRKDGKNRQQVKFLIKNK